MPQENSNIVNVVSATSLPVIRDASDLDGKAFSAFDKLTGRAVAVDASVVEGMVGGSNASIVGTTLVFP